MIPESQHSGAHVLTTDGVVIGQVREVQHRSDGSLWVEVINPQLVAEGRELLLPVSPEHLERGWVRVPFTGPELQTALYGAEETVLAVRSDSPPPSTQSDGVSWVHQERIVADRRRQEERQLAVGLHRRRSDR